MPRRAKGPRLYLRERHGRGAVWVILGLGPELSTGCSTGDVEGAQRELGRRITEKYQPPKTGGQLDRTFIADVMNVYMQQRAPMTAHPKVVACLSTPILEWWGRKALSDIRANTCDDYVKWRTIQKRQRRKAGTVSRQTARHELTLLRTAINYYHANYGPLTAVPVVSMPPSNPPRLDYSLTRKQVADRIRAARQLPKCGHVIRELLIGAYTGTRPGATRRLRWVPSTSGGWFDLETQTLHRRAQGVHETNKRQPLARIHRRLLPWLKRWYRADMEIGVSHRKAVDGRRVKVTAPSTYVIHYGGQPLKRIQRSWQSIALAAGHTRQDGPHIMRHTAATWQMQAGVNIHEAAGYLGMSYETLLDVYGHHHPEFQDRAASADGRRAQSTPKKRVNADGTKPQ